MGVVLTRRQRLTSGVIAAAAFAAIGAWSFSAHAQRNPPPPPPAVDCTSERATDGLQRIDRLAPRNINAQQGALNSALENISRFKNTPTSTDFASLETARRDCEQARRAGATYSVQGYMCSAEASLLLAQRRGGETRNADFRQAYCRYDTAARLTTRLGASAREARAAAEAGSGQTLLAWRESGAERPSDYLRDAIVAYETAVNTRTGVPTAERHLALGRAYILQSDQTRAAAQLDAAYGMNPNVDGIALGYVALANLLGPTSPQATRYLERANAAAQNSLSVTSALGIAYYNAREWSRARDTLRRATTLPASANDARIGGINYEAQAYHHLALLDVPDAGRGAGGAWGSVLANARTAVDKGGVDDERQLRCIAYVINGWPVRESNPSFCEVGSDAKGWLLRAMYQLRAAQNIRPRQIDTAAQRAQWDTYVQALSAAASTFDNGIAVARQMPNPNVAFVDRDATFNVLHMLQFGRAVVAPGCSQLSTSGVQPPAPPIDPAIDVGAATQFYSRFGVYNCRRLD